MAEIKYLDLSGLSHYDGKIKSHISAAVEGGVTGLVSEITSIAVVGEEVVLTYKVVGDEAAKTITLPKADLKGLIGEVSDSESGLMIAADKTKLDGIAEGAQVNVVEGISLNGHAFEIGADKIASAEMTFDWEAEGSDSLVLKIGEIEIGKIDTTKFVKDGIVSEAELITIPDDEAATVDRPAGKYIKISWSGDAGTDPTYINVTDLVDIHNVIGDDVAAGELVKVHTEVTGSGTSMDPWKVSAKLDETALVAALDAKIGKDDEVLSVIVGSETIQATATGSGTYFVIPANDYWEVEFTEFPYGVSLFECVDGAPSTEICSVLDYGDGKLTNDNGKVVASQFAWGEYQIDTNKEYALKFIYGDGEANFTITLGKGYNEQFNVQQSISYLNENKADKSEVESSLALKANKSDIDALDLGVKEIYLGNSDLGDVVRLHDTSYYNAGPDESLDHGYSDLESGSVYFSKINHGREEVLIGNVVGFGSKANTWEVEESLNTKIGKDDEMIMVPSEPTTDTTTYSGQGYIMTSLFNGTNWTVECTLNHDNDLINFILLDQDEVFNKELGSFNKKLILTNDNGTVTINKDEQISTITIDPSKSYKLYALDSSVDPSSHLDVTITKGGDIALNTKESLTHLNDTKANKSEVETSLDTKIGKDDIMLGNKQVIILDDEDNLHFSYTFEDLSDNWELSLKTYGNFDNDTIAINCVDKELIIFTDGTKDKIKIVCNNGVISVYKDNELQPETATFAPGQLFLGFGGAFLGEMTLQEGLSLNTKDSFEYLNNTLSTKITAEDLPTTVSQLTNDAGYAVAGDLKIAEVTEGLGENVAKAYKFEGGAESAVIEIPKDQTLKSVELGKYATEGDATSFVVDPTGEILRFTYIIADGSEKVVDVNVSNLITEAELDPVYDLIDTKLNAADVLTVSNDEIDAMFA